MAVNVPIRPRSRGTRSTVPIFLGLAVLTPLPAFAANVTTLLVTGPAGAPVNSPATTALAGPSLIRPDQGGARAADSTSAATVTGATEVPGPLLYPHQSTASARIDRADQPVPPASGDPRAVPAAPGGPADLGTRSGRSPPPPGL